jgi:hypothetical protein
MIGERKTGDDRWYKMFVPGQDYKPQKIAGAPKNFSS